MPNAATGSTLKAQNANTEIASKSCHAPEEFRMQHAVRKKRPCARANHRHQTKNEAQGKNLSWRFASKRFSARTQWRLVIEEGSRARVGGFEGILRRPNVKTAAAAELAELREILDVHEADGEMLLRHPEPGEDAPGQQPLNHRLGDVLPERLDGCRPISAYFSPTPHILSPQVKKKSASNLQPT